MIYVMGAFIAIGALCFCSLGAQVAVSMVDQLTQNKIKRVLGYYILVPLFSGGFPVPCCFFFIPAMIWDLTYLEIAGIVFVYSTFQLILTKIIFHFNPARYKDLIDPNRECMLDYSFTSCMMRVDSDYIKKMYLHDKKYIKKHPITKRDVRRFPW